MNVGRVCPAVTVLNGYIYIAGGDTANSVELYNPNTDEWTKIAQPVEHCANKSTEVGEMGNMISDK